MVMAPPSRRQQKAMVKRQVIVPLEDGIASPKPVDNLGQADLNLFKF